MEERKKAKKRGRKKIAFSASNMPLEDHRYKEAIRILMSNRITTHGELAINSYIKINPEIAKNLRPNTIR